MCGLFGVFDRTGLTKQAYEALCGLSAVSVMRGTDSGGLVKYSKDKSVQCTRTLNTVVDLTLKAKDSSDYGPNIYAYMGHARASTIGATNIINAQPIEYGHIVGCHNGTVTGIADYKVGTSDSHALYEKMSDKGLEETVDYIKNGAYCLTWIDKNDDTLNFLRNNERPLYIYQNGAEVFWASEAIFLFFALGRAGYSKVADFVFELKEHEHLSWNLHTGALTRKEVKPKKGHGFFSYESWSSIFNEPEEKKTAPKKQETRQVIRLPKNDNKKKDLYTRCNVPPTGATIQKVIVPNVGTYSLEEYKAWLRTHGICAYTNQTLEYDDPVYLDQTGGVYCQDAVDDDFLIRYVGLISPVRYQYLCN